MQPRRPNRAFRAFAADERGNSATEFALWLTLLVIPTLNVIDLGFYIFKTMQVREAAQAGAEVAENTCGYNGFTPVATNCKSGTSTPFLSTSQITNAVQKTTLSTAVTLSTTSPPTEGWYCNDTTGKLVAAKTGGTAMTPWNAVGGTPSPTTIPTDCQNTVSGDTDAPGDYVFVTVNYTYNALLGSASLISLLSTNSTITQTGWMRIS